MDNMGINPMRTNGGRSGQNTPSGHTAGNGAGVTRGVASGGYQSPSVQAQRQFGVARPATSLRLGDVIRGEISDLSGKEITITLENNTMIRGQISDSSYLSIGQTAAFRLDSLTSQGVLLEPVSGYTETELTIINKALQEAGLPASEHNQAAVKALMDNVMPINREAIQQLMQQAYDMKTNDMNTLALMNRLFIPVTPENVEQFSNYRMGQNQIAVQLEQFSNDLPQLLQSLAENGGKEAVAGFANTLLQITLSDLPQADTTWTLSDLSEENQALCKELLSQLEFSPALQEQLADNRISLGDTLTLLKQGLLDHSITLPADYTEEALLQDLLQLEQKIDPESGLSLDQLKELFSQTEIDESVTDAQAAVDSADETVPTAEEQAAQEATANTSEKGFARFFHSLQDTVNQSLNGALDRLHTTETANAHPLSALLAELGDAAVADGQVNHRLHGFLTSDARASLADLLGKLPISSSLVEQIRSGQATAEEVAHVLKNVISFADSSILKEVFRSDAFEQIFAKALQSSWYLTPEQLAKDGEPSHFFERLSGQMNSLEQLIGNSLSGSDSQGFRREAKDIQSNIQFMKELNETFSYLQLPLRLPHQTANSELYVYTSKQQRRSNPDKNSVLLHLDLEHLGTVEIRLDQNHNEISAMFHVQEDSSVNLLRTNMEQLENSLASLGYHSNLQVQKQEEAPVSMDAFLNTRIKTNATEEMKRFSFDIRA